MSHSTQKEVVFIPFTKELHKFLINEGYTQLKNIGYLPGISFFKEQGIELDGYGLEPSIWQLIEDGNAVRADDTYLTITKVVHLPKDPTDPSREEILKQSKMIAPLEEMLKVFGADNGEDYTVIGWNENAPPDISMTTAGLNFGLSNEKTYQLYNNPDNIRFYLVLSIKELKDHKLLYRKITAGMATVPKSKRLRKI